MIYKSKVEGMPLLTSSQCEEILAEVSRLVKTYGHEDDVKKKLGAHGYHLGYSRTQYSVATKAGGHKFEFAKRVVNQNIQSFGWLFIAVHNYISQFLEKPVIVDEESGFGFFRLFYPCQANYDLFEVQAPFHTDYEDDFSKRGNLEDVMAVTLAISGDKKTFGLQTMPLHWFHTINLTNQEIDEALRISPVEYHPYKIGHMYMHSGLWYHKGTGMTTRPNQRPRLTFQTFLEKRGGKYYLVG